MTKLFLLRHGPTNASIIGAPLGVLDWPVTYNGHMLWPKIKSELLKLGIRQVLTSTLTRAKRHATDLTIPYRILPELNEQNFGVWDGIPWSKITTAQPFFNDPIHYIPPGGESFHSCAARAASILTNHWDSNTPTLILAHSGTLKAILANLLKLPLSTILQFAWNPYGLSKLDIYQYNATLCYHNYVLPSGNHCHIDNNII